MSSSVFTVQNEFISQELMMEAPKASECKIKFLEILLSSKIFVDYEEFDEESQDDIDGGELMPLRGIDDGLIERKPKKPEINGNSDRRIPAGYFPQWPGSYPIDAASPDTIPSLNLYQQKKTIAQGMLDLALLSANANQLRYVLEYKERNHYYYVSLTLISLSLVLQVLVACALVFKSRYNIDNEQEYINADRINNFITMGILFITIINVFTSAFGVMPSQTFIPVQLQDATVLSVTDKHEFKEE